MYQLKNDKHINTHFEYYILVLFSSTPIAMNLISPKKETYLLYVVVDAVSHLLLHMD